MRIWLTGASGLLGSSLLKALRDRGISCIGSKRQDVDITQLNAIADFCRSHGPFTHIINCAAFTAVDLAESHQEEAHKVNALAPALLGLFAANAGIRIIHLSTDYVFNGKANIPYKEEDPVAPQTIYGKTKAEGEQRLLAFCPQACIIRTSWLFGANGKNFVTSILTKMREQEELKVVSDQRGKPTYVGDLVQVLIEALDWSGIYHIANQEETSWYHFAEMIREEGLARGISLKCKRIHPITTANLAAPAIRPLYSVLNTQKGEKLFGSSFPSWREGLKQMFVCT